MCFAVLCFQHKHYVTQQPWMRLASETHGPIRAIFLDKEGRYFLKLVIEGWSKIKTFENPPLNVFFLK